MLAFQRFLPTLAPVPLSCAAPFRGSSGTMSSAAGTDSHGERRPSKSVALHTPGGYDEHRTDHTVPDGLSPAHSPREATWSAPSSSTPSPQCLRKQEYFASIEQVPYHKARLDAVIRRLLANKDNMTLVSLFAWGRMTFTIKDEQTKETRELWKPKRSEALAIFAYIYQHQAELFKEQAPAYEFVFEDASTLRNTVGITVPSTPASDFVGLQREFDTHWGVHKRKMCPALRQLSAVRRPLSPSMVVGMSAPLHTSSNAMGAGASSAGRHSASTIGTSARPTSPPSAAITTQERSSVSSLSPTAPPLSTSAPAAVSKRPVPPLHAHGQQQQQQQQQAKLSPPASFSAAAGLESTSARAFHQQAGLTAGGAGAIQQGPAMVAGLASPAADDVKFWSRPIAPLVPGMAYGTAGIAPRGTEAAQQQQQHQRGAQPAMVLMQPVLVSSPRQQQQQQQMQSVMLFPQPTTAPAAAATVGVVRGENDAQHAAVALLMMHKSHDFLPDTAQAQQPNLASVGSDGTVAAAAAATPAPLLTTWAAQPEQVQPPHQNALRLIADQQQWHHHHLQQQQQQQQLHESAPAAGRQLSPKSAATTTQLFHPYSHHGHVAPGGRFRGQQQQMQPQPQHQQQQHPYPPASAPWRPW